LGRTHSISLGKHATIFQAEVYAILACVYEIQVNVSPEKYISICSDSHAALKALQAATTTFPLVRKCQKAFNDISPGHTVGPYWVPGHAGVRGNEISDNLAGDGSVQKFVGPEPSMRVSTQNMKRTTKTWVDNQHLAR